MELSCSWKCHSMVLHLSPLWISAKRPAQQKGCMQKNSSSWTACMNVERLLESNLPSALALILGYDWVSAKQAACISLWQRQGFRDCCDPALMFLYSWADCLKMQRSGLWP